MEIPYTAKATITVQFWENGADPRKPTVEVEAVYNKSTVDWHEYLATTATGVFEIHIPIGEKM